MMHYLRYIAFAVGSLGVAVIIWGVITSVVHLALIERKRLSGANVCRNREFLRLHLGSYLLIGLEILVAADIVRTVISPSIDELIILGSIVAIRTVLNYFLSKELGAHDCET